MSDGTKIEWTDATWNPITGCSVVSPGCTNCYAMGLAGTRLRNHPSRAGLTDESKAGPVWNGKVRLNEEWLTQPLKWRRPRMIFVCAHGDLFHEAVPDEWIDRVFAVMALSPQHTFQVLTKRAKRMREYFSRRSADDHFRAWTKMFSPGTMPITQHEIEARLSPDVLQVQRDLYRATRLMWPLPNIWLGVSAEDQKRADERVPDLLATPAAVRFVSAEPLLGPIDFREIGGRDGDGFNAFDDGADDGVRAEPVLDWIIVGGESGPSARPMHPAWARAIRDQCAAAGVAFFFKQWGEFAPDDDAPGAHTAMRRVGKARAGRILDGRTHDDTPQRSA